MDGIAISNEDILLILDIVIKWLPTILFALIVVGSTLTGFRRGFRKSMILLINALVVGSLCIALYFFLVNTKAGDRLILEIINLFLGGESALQNALGVDSGIDTLTLVIVEVLKSEAFGFGESVGIVMQDNGAYLAVIVNLVYHLIFALALYIVYLLLIFVLYIFYLLFNSERVHRKRVFKKFQHYKADSTYKKRRIYGSIVGFCRGLFSGIMTLSMVGSLLFVVSAGKGEGNLKDRDFGNDNYNTIYKAYQTIGSYGTEGIYQVLNVVQNEEEVPYYLLLTDIIFQGKYTEEELGGVVNEHSLVIREELSTYTKFLLDAVDVVFKYKEETVMQFVNGEISSDALINELTGLFSDPNFQYDFSMLIESFNDDTYFFNFALSLVDTIVSNIDNPSLGLSLDPVVQDAIKVLFSSKPVDSIRAERLMKETNRDVSLPHIDPSKLLEKSDVTLLLGMVFALMEANTTNMTEILDSVIVIVKQLSIFKTHRKEEMNSMLARFYNFIDSVLLSKESITPLSEVEEEIEQDIEKEIKVYLYQLESDNIDWIGEITMLIDVIPDFMILSEVLSNETKGLEGIMAIFDSENENHEKVYNSYTNVKNALIKSRMIGKVLKSKTIASTISSMLSALSPSYQMPEDIVFENTYVGETLIQTGELYNLLNCIEHLVTNGVLEELLDLTGSFKGFDDLKRVLNVLNKEDEELLTPIDYIFKSKIFTSVISSVLVDFANTPDSILYITSDAYEVTEEGYPSNIIDSKYLKEALLHFPDFIELIEPLLNGDENANIVNIIKSNEFKLMLENPIVKGTIANVLVKTFKDNELIIIPTKYEDINELAAQGESELNRLLNCIEILDVDFTNVNADSMTSRITELGAREIDILLESDIVRYTISNVLTSSLGDFIVVPNTCKDIVKDDVINSVITKDVLVDLIYKMDLILEIDIEGKEPSELVSYIVSIKNDILTNDVLLATTIYIMNQSLTESMVMPDSLIEGAQKSELETRFDTNPWKEELFDLFDALDELFDLSSGSFDIQDIEGRIFDLILEYDKPSKVNNKSTRLEMILNSDIINYNISSILDEFLTKDVIDPLTKEYAQDYLNSAYKEKVYTVKELYSIFTLLRKLNLLSEDGFGTIDFSSISIDNDFISMFNTEEDIYLIRGILTKQIKNIITENGAGLKSHPAAYDKNVSTVLKHNEIISILEMTKDSLNGFSNNSFIASDISLNQYLSYIYDVNGECKSYLITATISDYIVDNASALNLVIPSKAAYKGTNIIDNIELYRLLSYLSNINNGDSLSSINISSDFLLEEKLFESSILNATVLSNFSIGDSLGLYALQDEIVVTTNMINNQTIYYLSEKGYKALCSSMRAGFTTTAIGNHTLTYEYITGLSHSTLEEMMKSGIIRIAISDILKEEYDKLPDLVKSILELQFELKTENVRVFDLSSNKGRTELKEVYQEDNIILVIEALQYAASL